ncbi:MAG: ribbon-helix-helix protein, CopG family [Ardenticatenaceae bacterium]|nr:ribbon-helix-helix protein, CopG family [Ardenticatenaceae bacterium]
MKTAISIPDPLFAEAEKLAQRLGMSRSEFYARALAAYIEEYRDEDVTEALDILYGEESSALDPMLQQMQWLSLSEEEW